MRGLRVRFVFYPVFLLISGLWLSASFAEKLVDPNAVAPEFREAAVKRRAEQLKLSDCNKKADQAKVLPRDRTPFVSQCLEK